MTNKTLDEDQDILDELNDVEKYLEHKSTTTNYKLDILIIKSSLRNRGSLERFNKNTEKYSAILLVLAFTQVIVGIGAVQMSLGIVAGIIMTIFYFGFMLFMFYATGIWGEKFGLPVPGSRWFK